MPLALVSVVHSATEEPSRDSKELEPLIHHLSELQELGADYWTILRIDDLGMRKVASNVAQAPQPWDNVPIESSRRCRWAAFDGQRMYADMPQNPSKSGTAQKGLRNSREFFKLWTGTEWWEEMQRPGVQQCLIQPHPRRDGPVAEYMSLFNGALDWPDFASMGGLKRSLAQITLLNTAESEHDWKFEFAWSEIKSAPHVEIVLGKNPSVHLISITLTVFKKSELELKPFGFKKLVIQDWEQREAVLFPRAAIFLQGRFDSIADPHISATRVTRLESGRVSTTDGTAAWFDRPILEVGTEVVDECLGLRYVIGESVVQISDIGPFDTAKPIMERLTSRVRDLAREHTTTQDKER